MNKRKIIALVAIFVIVLVGGFFLGQIPMMNNKAQLLEEERTSRFALLQRIYPGIINVHYSQIANGSQEGAQYASEWMAVAEKMLESPEANKFSMYGFDYKFPISEEQKYNLIELARCMKIVYSDISNEIRESEKPEDFQNSSAMNLLVKIHDLTYKYTLTSSEEYPEEYKKTGIYMGVKILSSGFNKYLRLFETEEWKVFLNELQEYAKNR